MCPAATHSVPACLGCLMPHCHSCSEGALRQGPIVWRKLRGLGAGWSVCVNILQSLRKPPTLAPQVLQSFVCARGKMGTSRMPAWA